MINKIRLENLSNEVFKGAIKLRGKFKAKDYPMVILPMIMIRRIECVLEENRAKFKSLIIAKDDSFDDDNIKALYEKDAEKGKVKQAELTKRIKQYEKAKLEFYNTTNWTLKSILADSSTLVESNFRSFLNGFSENLEEIVDKFEYRQTVTKMVKEKRLSQIIRLVAEEDFSPTRLSNIEMGYVYENLLQRFSQDDAKDTGEHFTPREIIRIMVDLMEIDFDPETATKAISLYDPACGTGGMLSIAKEHLIDKAKTPKGIANTEDLILLNGQEMLAQNYAVCKADMLLKGETKANITHGNSLIPHIESIEDDGDRHSGKRFDYMISNPPFGVDWSDYKSHVEKLIGSRYQPGATEKSGKKGQYTITPTNDGALLFLLTMLEKMKPRSKGGSKIAILFNGSPLSNGDATQSESEIRRYILENDLLDTIVMMPDQMFYNTGIYTYIWILNNNKATHKKEHVLLINARQKFEKEPKSFGHKRNRITDDNRKWIQSNFTNWKANEECKKFHTTDFAFHKVKVTFWQEDENGKPMWITEDYTKQISNANMKKAFDLYGDFTVNLKVNELEFEIRYDGETVFETLVANLLKEKVAELKNEKLNYIKEWFKNQEKTATYHHRDYIVDNEYIPFDRTEDKETYINTFLAKEIDCQIIDWNEYKELGYEILPNKYFYKYQEPESSDVLIDQFWKLEEEATSLLNEIKDL
jgi:type I restriction enzyme M protein